MDFFKQNLQKLLILAGLCAVCTAAQANENTTQKAPEGVTTNTTMTVTGTHFPRSPTWRDKISVYETNLVWAATGEPIYFLRNKVNIQSSHKLFSQEDYQFERFVQELYEKGDICVRKGTSTTRRKFDMPNNRYPWKSTRTFSEKIIYEGPADEFPGINLKAGRILSEFGGVTNGWSKQEEYHPQVLHTFGTTNITNEADRRYYSINLDTRKDARKPGVVKEKYGVIEVLTKQDSYPQEIDYIRHKTVLIKKDLGNGKIAVKGRQKGRAMHIKETQRKLLSNWNKYKKGEVYTPFPSSIQSSDQVFPAKDVKNVKKVSGKDLARRFINKTNTRSS